MTRGEQNGRCGGLIMTAITSTAHGTSFYGLITSKDSYFFVGPIWDNSPILDALVTQMTSIPLHHRLGTILILSSDLHPGLPSSFEAENVYFFHGPSI